MANVSLYASRFNIQESGSLRIIAWTLVADAEVNLDPFHRLRKMEFPLWIGKELLYSRQELDLCIYPGWMGPFHITSSG